VAQLSALVYGDVDLNLIDGSAIWVQSTVQALARAGCRVTLLVKSPVRTDRLIAPLLAEPGVTVRRPHAEHLISGLGTASLSAAQAARLLAQLDQSDRQDLVILRGWRVVSQVVAGGALAGRLWTYLTDIPQSVAAMTDEKAADLNTIAAASRYLLCQTEELRSFLEGNAPQACGKCVLMPPVVPAAVASPGREPAGTPATGGVLRLVYTGKFAPRWNTYEMTQLPGLLAARGVPAEVHMVGDKIHSDPADPGYSRRMRAALGPVRTSLATAGTGPPGRSGGGGVIWHGGRSRDEAMRIAASCDVGLSWRDPSLDASLELSTKVLEYGVLGLPVILNRTPMHEQLLGADYPLFARDLAEVADTAAVAAGDPAVAQLAAARTAAAARAFTLEAAAGRLRGYLDRAFPAPAASAGPTLAGPTLARPTLAGPTLAGPTLAGPTLAAAGPAAAPLRVAVAGHDLKFFGPILAYLREQPGLEVRVDHWETLGRHSGEISAAMARWADVVICEWCGPNAIWYSRHKRRGSRLIVRLHRFELAAGYPNLVDIRAIDQVVCVSRHYARLCRERVGWPAGKVVVIPNAVDAAQLDRSKLEGARYHLGIIGIVPARKRLDLALDVLEELRRRDDRYLLFIKSGMPWDHWWVWRKAEERAHYTTALRRIQRSALLRGAVVFDEAGPDVPAWLRRVGFVLSTSDDESFHVAPAEGMASRAVPVLRHWPGAETIYDMRWIHRTPADMAQAIAAMGDGGWRQAGDLAQEQAAGAFAMDKVRGSWLGLLTSDLPPAVPDPLYELLGAP
jgi:glycosyltransferase involved in cell wall biosynthesis